MSGFLEDLKRWSWSTWMLIGLVFSSPVIYTFMKNEVGPSTRYESPTLPTAVKKADGKEYVYLGDEFYVSINVVRHAQNGNCIFDIRRYFEKADGPDAGKRFLVSHAELQFIGQDESRRARWPSPPDKYIIGYGVNDDNETQMDQPLLEPGQEQQDFIAYVKGRYYCNFLDYIIPRYIQGTDRPDETPHVRFTVKRNKP